MSTVGLVLAGRLKTTACTDGGRLVVLSMASPGDFVGHTDAINGTTHSATVITVGAADVWQMPVDRFTRMILDCPAVARRLVQALSRSTATAMLAHRTAAVGSTSSRLARLLTEMSTEGCDSTSSGRRDLVLTQSDLAELIGASRESVVRTLTRFRAAGLIETGRRRVRILDAARLASVV